MSVRHCQAMPYMSQTHKSRSILLKYLLIRTFYTVGHFNKKCLLNSPIDLKFGFLVVHYHERIYTKKKY